MTQPDSPDYFKAMPGGARALINTTVNLLSSSGSYVSPYLDVTPYNGLYVDLAGPAFNTDYGSLQVSFNDVDRTLGNEPTFQLPWRGDLRTRVNVPVLGAQARVFVTGPQRNNPAPLVVVGHGGGGSSSFRVPGGQLAGVWGQALAGFTAATISASVISEGPGHVSLSSSGQPGHISVTAFDFSGNSQLLTQLSVGASGGASAELWLPAAPLVVTVANDGAGAGTFWGGLWLGRA